MRPLVSHIAGLEMSYGTWQMHWGAGPLWAGAPMQSNPVMAGPSKPPRPPRGGQSPPPGIALGFGVPLDGSRGGAVPHPWRFAERVANEPLGGKSQFYYNREEAETRLIALLSNFFTSCYRVPRKFSHSGPRRPLGAKGPPLGDQGF